MVVVAERLQRVAVVCIAVCILAACGRAVPASYVEQASGIRFLLIPPGRFVMGSPVTEPGHRPDEQQHEVVLRHPFFLSATEVTQQQWTSVMGYNPSHFTVAGMSAPVEQVTWYEAQEFVRRLNALNHALNQGTFRLPTEAEWEYACRAGTKTVYNYGNQASWRLANFDGRYPLAGQPAGAYRARTVAVAGFRPNAWGLYDMHGNVWEWCDDEYCPYPATPVEDPRQRCASAFKVIRGGSWYFDAASSRTASRYTHQPQLHGFSIGFRVVREAGPGGPVRASWAGSAAR
ncbi:MAG: formylglycine-generating enzyme family protein [Acidobacteriota bacterium]